LKELDWDSAWDMNVAGGKELARAAEDWSEHDEKVCGNANVCAFGLANVDGEPNAGDENCEEAENCDAGEPGPK
jgi:hypothetical protein